MRSNVKNFACLAGRTLPLTEPIFEFGSLQVPGQTGFADLRPLFPDLEYVGCDMQQGPGVDRVLNLHDIHVADSSVGTVLCFDTLEHVEFPRKAMDEIHRILKPDGIAVISSVMNFPIHDYPYDYWRYTPEAFRSILKPFNRVFTGYQGRKDFPHTVVGIGVKGKTEIPSEFLEGYRNWQKSDLFSLRQIVMQCMPPLMLPAASHLNRLLRKFTRRN